MSIFVLSAALAAMVAAYASLFSWRRGHGSLTLTAALFLIAGILSIHGGFLLSDLANQQIVR